MNCLLLSCLAPVSTLGCFMGVMHRRFGASVTNPNARLPTYLGVLELLFRSVPVSVGLASV